MVDDDVVRVNVVFGEVLDESFGFIEREKFRDADANKCCYFLMQKKGKKGTNILMLMNILQHCKTIEEHIQHL